MSESTEDKFSRMVHHYYAMSMFLKASGHDGQRHLDWLYDELQQFVAHHPQFSERLPYRQITIIDYGPGLKSVAELARLSRP